MRKHLLIAVISLLLAASSGLNVEAGSDGKAVVIEISGTIDGGALSTFEKGLEIFESVGADVVILRIDSYGGFLSAADRIVNLILERNLNCYSWVPPGGKAVSAASLVALACREIYMSPGSVIGAAEPSPSDEKTVNYVRSRFRTLAERRFGESSELVKIAESFVTNNTVLTYAEATEVGFAKPVSNFEELLKTLNVSEYEVVSPGLWEQILSVISNPVVSSMALFVASLLILVEVLQTGFQGYVIPGVILLALSLYSMALVPVSILILAVVISAVVLLAIEIYQPGFGVFGISGIALLILATYLIYRFEPYYVIASIHYAIIAGLAMFGGFLIYIAYEASKALRMKKHTFKEKLMGRVGHAKTDILPGKEGVVYVEREDWTAYLEDGEEPVRKGEKVVVTRVEGLKLYVRKVREGGEGS